MLLSEHLLCIYYHLASIFKKSHPTYLLFSLLKITYHIFCCNIMLYGCAVQGVPERYILFLEKINLFGSQYMCFSTAFGLARSGVHNVSSENYSIQLAGEMYSLYSKVPQHALQATAILFCSLKKKKPSFNQQFL